MNDVDRSQFPASLPCPVEAILWDLDGTLVDSAAATLQALTRALLSFGHDVNGIDSHRFVGPPLTESLLARGLRHSEIEAVRKLYLEEFIATGVDAVEPFAGVLPLLADLHRRGIAQGVISNRLQETLSRIVAHVGLGAFLDVSVGREEVRQTKYDVAIAALRHLKSNPSRDVVLIGDRDEDLAVGRQLGLTTIGVEWGYAGPDELDSPRADYLISSVQSLARLLNAEPTSTEHSRQGP